VICVNIHRSEKATLKDDDWTVNFAELNHPSDRVAVIRTQPLTADEPRVAFSPNELQVFVECGRPFAQVNRQLADFFAETFTTNITFRPLDRFTDVHVHICLRVTSMGRQNIWTQ
jgi:hypothetical protein